jgi:hypothetical protein
LSWILSSVRGQQGSRGATCVVVVVSKKSTHLALTLSMVSDDSTSRVMAAGTQSADAPGDMGAGGLTLAREGLDEDLHLTAREKDGSAQGRSTIKMGTHLICLC